MVSGTTAYQVRVWALVLMGLVGWCAVAAFAEDKADAKAGADAASGAESTPATPATRSVAAQRELPTTEQIKNLMDQEKYAEADRAITQILSIKGPVAEYDRPELYMLRAECELQMKQNGQSVATLEYVAKEADAANNQDLAGRALALALLVRVAPQGLYAPRLGDNHVPLDICDRAKREEAYAKLYDDEAARLDKQITDARGATSIAPLLEIAKKFRAVKGLERITSGGNTSKCDELAPRVTGVASRLIDSSLEEYRNTLKRIDRESSQIVTQQQVNLGGGRRGNGPRMEKVHRQMGLTRENVETLKKIVATCTKIPDAVTTFNLAFATPHQFENFSNRAENIRVTAEALLRKDFSN